MIKLLAALLALFIGSAQAADNTAVTAGTGTTMATKDIGGGVQAPKVYLVDGTGNPCTTTAGGTASCVIVIEGVSGGVPVMVNVQNGVTQSGTWTVQPGNTANTTPWLATVSQGGNNAIVAAGASPYGAALAVAGGITPAAATSLNPLSSPVLVAVVTPGSTNYTQGQLQIPTMDTAGFQNTHIQASVALNTIVQNGVTQSGTWTVQPGNTINASPWLVNVVNGVTQGSAPWTVQGTSGGGVAQNVIVATGVTGGNAQSALFSGVTGMPMLAAVTTANNNNFTTGQLQIPIATTGGALGVAVLAQPVGGATPYHLAGGSTGSSTNATLIATGPHTLYGFSANNPTVLGIVYVRLYDSAAAPTCSSATGAVSSLAVPTSVTSGGEYTLALGTAGIKFANGIGFCITTTNSDTANTGPTSAGITINAAYF